MDYCLKKHESFSAGCQRVACEEIAAVLQDLHACGMSDDPAKPIHDARKHLKKLQALLRLLRPCIGEEAFVRERGRFRRAAQRLASARDAEVCVRTLEELHDVAPADARTVVDAVHAIFTTILDHHRKPAQRTLDSIAASLIEAAAAIREWNFESEGDEALAKGLERIYRRARKSGARAVEKPSTKRLHRWRQRTKELWSVLRLFRQRNDRALAAKAKDAQKLGELLGKDHDLAVLKDAIHEEHRSVLLEMDSIVALEHLIDTRRAQLQRDAWQIGEGLFEKKPKKFAEAFFCAEAGK